MSLQPFTFNANIIDAYKLSKNHYITLTVIGPFDYVTHMHSCILLLPFNALQIFGSRNGKNTRNKEPKEEKTAMVDCKQEEETRPVIYFQSCVM